MRISLDVDDTLVCHFPGARHEPQPLLIRWFAAEPLRRGTRELITELRRRGCEIWIYTSSLRTTLHIRLWLLLHGIRVDGIVNEERHRQELLRRRFPHSSSKYPPAFGIDLHVDDSPGVLMEGKKHDFRVLMVATTDLQWTQKILDVVEQLLTQAAPER